MNKSLVCCLLSAVGAFGLMPLARASVVVEDGVFTVEGDETYSENVSYATIIKRGSGKLTFTGTLSGTSSITVEAGTLAVTSEKLYAAGMPDITVDDGATIDVSGEWTQGEWTLFCKTLTLTGSGVGNVGAFVRSGNHARSGIKTLILAGDTTMNIAAGNLGSQNGVYLKGFRLTKTGTGSLYSFRRPWYPDDGDKKGSIDLQAGCLRIENTGAGTDAMSMGGSADNLLILNGGYIETWCTEPELHPIKWTIDVRSSNVGIYSNGQDSENKRSVFAGPVYVTNTTFKINGNPNNTTYFTGPVTIVNEKVGGDWTGRKISIESGSNYLVFKGAIDWEFGGWQWTVSGGASRMTFDGCPSVKINGYWGGEDWKVLNCASFQSSGGHNYVNAPSGGKLAMSVTNASYQGSYLFLASSGDLPHGVVTVDKSTYVGNQLRLADHSSKGGTGTLIVKNGSNMSLAESSIGTQAASRGYVYAQDSTLSMNSVANLGGAGFGYLFATNCTVNLGAGVTMAKDGGLAILRLAGKPFKWNYQCNASMPATAPAGATAVYVIEDGADNVTAAGSERTFTFPAGENAVTNIVSLRNGGAYYAFRFMKGEGDQAAADSPSKLYLNVDGGTVGATWGSNWFGGNSGSVNDLIVHEGGIVVDTSRVGGGGEMLLPVAHAPTGKIVKSIALPTDAGFDATSYVAVPKVTIHGVGAGAAAVAVLDPETLTVTGIEVLAPGSGYDENTTATIESADAGTSYACVVTCVDAPTTGKGLKKIGANGLRFSMSGSLTYHGPTEIAEGTATFFYSSYPSGSPLVLGEGMSVNFSNASIGTIPYIAGHGIVSNSNVTVSEKLKLELSDKSPLTVQKALTVQNGGAIEISVADGFDLQSLERITLVETIEGNLTLPAGVTVTGLPENWKLRYTSKKITAGCSRGMTIIFR